MSRPFFVRCAPSEPVRSLKPVPGAILHGQPQPDRRTWNDFDTINRRKIAERYAAAKAGTLAM